MKTRGLMLIAVLFSGATFAQTTSVKVKSQPGNEGTTAKGNATAKSAVIAENEAATTANTQSTIAFEKDISGTTGLLESTASEIKGTADDQINTAVETGKQSTIQVAQGIKNTLNTSAGISGSLLKTTNLKIAPVKINTRIISTTGLFIR